MFFSFLYGAERKSLFFQLREALFVSARGGGIPRFGSEPEDGAHSLSLGELDQALEELEVRSDEHR